MFGNQKVLRNINYTFEAGGSYAILGGNGSGKSTLLRIVQGSLTPSSGQISYFDEKGQKISREEMCFKISLSGPYSELIEELTAHEFLAFYAKFRPWLAGLDARQVLEICMLQEASAKLIRNFSSGMKQRLRLGLSLLVASEIILLDEPTSNLDPQGIAWYNQLVEKYRNGRTILVGSNHQESEMGFCQQRVELSSFG